MTYEFLQQYWWFLVSLLGLHALHDAVAEAQPIVDGFDFQSGSENSSYKAFFTKDWSQVI